MDLHPEYFDGFVAGRKQGELDTLTNVYNLLTVADGRTEAWEQAVEFIEKRVQELR